MIPAGNSRKLDFPLAYPADWSDAAKAGQPVDPAEVSAVLFKIKRRLSQTDATAEVTKTKDDGIIRVSEAQVAAYLEKTRREREETIPAKRKPPRPRLRFVR